MVAYGVLPALALLLAMGAGFLKWQDNSVRSSQIARIESVQAAKDSTIEDAVVQARHRRKQLNAARDSADRRFRD